MTFEWRRWIAGVTCDARLVVIDTLRRFHQLDDSNVHGWTVKKYSLIFTQCGRLGGAIYAEA